MKKLICLAMVLGLVLAGGVATAAIRNTAHDLSTSSTNVAQKARAGGNIDEICVWCHTPHGANLAVTGAPLWNHLAPAAGTFTLWSAGQTPTFDATAPVAISPVSQVCFSCHDGVSAVDALINPPNGAPVPDVTGTSIGGGGQLTSSAALDLNLTNDHPVSFTYSSVLTNNPSDETRPSVIVAGEPVVQNGTTTVPLFGTTAANATMECATCHEVHGNGNPIFLQVPNTASGLCLTCHIK